MIFLGMGAGMVGILLGTTVAAVVFLYWLKPPPPAGGRSLDVALEPVTQAEEEKHLLRPFTMVDFLGVGPDDRAFRRRGNRAS